MRLIIWILLVPGLHCPQETIKLSEVRSLYQHAAFSKQSSKQFSDLMNKVDSSFTLILQCYRGASLMMDAKYAINPFVKWSKFNAARGVIEAAISRDSVNLEMRFIRYSLQKNLPLFLGYNHELLVDKRFLEETNKSNGDIPLKQIINQCLTTAPPNKPAEKYNKN